MKRASPRATPGHLISRRVMKGAVQVKKQFSLVALTLAILLVSTLSPAWAKNMTWSGTVDDTVDIVISGRSVTYRNVTGGGVHNKSFQFNNNLPPYFQNARLDNAFGRGSINIVNRQNGQIVVRIQDPLPGSSNYRFTLRWEDNGGGDGNGIGITVPNGNGSNGGNNNWNGGSNSVRWQGQVEGVEDIHIVGRNVTWNLVTGTGSWNVRYNLNGALPARAVRVSLNRRQGRGSVYIVEQPNYNNNFICTIRIVDKAFGAGQYDITATW